MDPDLSYTEVLELGQACDLGKAPATSQASTWQGPDLPHDEHHPSNRSLGIPLVRAIGHYYSKIPPSTLRRWHDQLQQFCVAVTNDSVVTVGSGCTGCDIFAHVIGLIVQHWRSNFDSQIGALQFVLHCEKHPEKPQFLAEEFDISLLVPDIEQFHDHKVQNVVTGQMDYLPHTSIYVGGGFSCTDISKQNISRKNNKSNVAKKTGTTGTTLEACPVYIIKAKPRMSWLECVPEMDQEMLQEDGTYLSGSKVVEN